MSRVVSIVAALSPWLTSTISAVYNIFRVFIQPFDSSAWPLDISIRCPGLFVLSAQILMPPRHMHVIVLLLPRTFSLMNIVTSVSGSFGVVVSLCVTTMPNSGSYLVTPVASQLCSSTPVALTYSGHGRAVILPLSTTLGLIPVQSLLHLTVYPALMWVLRALNISSTLYHFHRTWPSPNSGCPLSAFKAVYLSP